MEKYNYKEVLRDDINSYIKQNANLSDYNSKDDAFNALYDDMFVSDSVTGNASGSYFCNAWKAEEAICHNLDLLEDALSEFGDTFSTMGGNAEAFDVTIRCYLLSEVLSEILDEFEFEN